MTQAKRKPMTQREKRARAAAKKELQEQGILPPDKKRLDRKKFAREVMTEWDEEMQIFEIGDAFCLSNAISCMVSSEMMKVTEEEVGVLKLLKIAMEIKKFRKKLKDENRESYTMGELYEVIAPILKL